MAAVVLVLMVVLLVSPAACGEETPPSTVEYVDVDRYVGLWYEIAKIPNRFQKKCAGGTTARYAIRDDGKIDVVNTCMKKDGDTYSVKGIAKIVDANTNAKLEVSFVSFLGMNFFWGDYWIIGLGDDYDYAVVGHPERKYGWILARTPKLEETTLDEIFAVLREKGYDPDDFEMTVQ